MITSHISLLRALPYLLLFSLAACSASPDASVGSGDASLDLAVAPFQANISGAVQSRLSGSGFTYAADAVVRTMTDNGSPARQLELSLMAQTPQTGSTGDFESGSIQLLFKGEIPPVGTYPIIASEGSQVFAGNYDYTVARNMGAASVTGVVQRYASSSGTLTITQSSGYLKGTLTMTAVKSQGKIWNGEQESPETPNGETVTVTGSFNVKMTVAD